MCCQSAQYMIRPCCCHVLSPWLGKLGLMFGISGLLGMLLLHDSCNCLSYFLCCLWSVLFFCGLIWSVSCLACICNLFLLYFCSVFYVVCSWVGSMCLASWGIVYQCLMLHVYMVDWTMWCFFFFCFHIKTNGTIWLLDPQNMDLDTKITILCVSVQKLWPNARFHKMAENIMYL